MEWVQLTLSLSISTHLLYVASPPALSFYFTRSLPSFLPSLTLSPLLQRTLSCPLEPGLFAVVPSATRDLFPSPSSSVRTHLPLRSAVGVAPECDTPLPEQSERWKDRWLSSCS